MYPKETAAFSTPPDRDGTNAQSRPDANGNGGVYTGDGDKTVALIDNVRDDNYYTFPAAPTYIAGFFSSQFNELFDRNVMTIDAFDWAHRTGANPPDEPTADLCTSRPARPFLYEGTFAHEWQHLLHYYTDPFETTWVNEGLSDFAQTLTGYVDATATVFDRGADSHLYCFQGFGTVQTPFNPNPRDCGGPENSLNLWGEGDNPNAVLADYGNAYSFMLFLYDRYGTDFMSGCTATATCRAWPASTPRWKPRASPTCTTSSTTSSRWTLLDKIVGDPRHGVVIGVPKSRVTTPSLRSTVNLANPDVIRHPGCRAQRRRLRAAAEGRRQPAAGPRPAVADVRRRGDPAAAAAGVDRRDQRPGPPGQPGAVVGQRQQPRRRRGHLGDRAGGRPDAALPREVRRGVRVRLRLRARCRPTAARPTRRSRATRPSTGRSGRRSTARRPGSSRTPSTCRRTPGRPCCSASATSATAASTRAAG